MVKGLHNKHIPTTWGVAILGFFLVVTALLIPVLNKAQVTQSHAYSSGSTTCSTVGCNCVYNSPASPDIKCGSGLVCVGGKTSTGAFVGKCQTKPSCSVTVNGSTKRGYCQPTTTRCLGLYYSSSSCYNVYGTKCCAK